MSRRALPLMGDDAVESLLRRLEIDGAETSTHDSVKPVRGVLGAQQLGEVVLAVSEAICSHITAPDEPDSLTEGEDSGSSFGQQLPQPPPISVSASFGTSVFDERLSVSAPSTPVLMRRAEQQGSTSAGSPPQSQTRSPPAPGADVASSSSSASADADGDADLCEEVASFISGVISRLSLDSEIVVIGLVLLERALHKPDSPDGASSAGSIYRSDSESSVRTLASDSTAPGCGKGELELSAHTWKLALLAALLLATKTWYDDAVFSADFCTPSLHLASLAPLPIHRLHQMEAQMLRHLDYQTTVPVSDATKSGHKAPTPPLPPRTLLTAPPPPHPPDLSASPHATHPRPELPTGSRLPTRPAPDARQVSLYARYVFALQDMRQAPPQSGRTIRRRDTWHSGDSLVPQALPVAEPVSISPPAQMARRKYRSAELPASSALHSHRPPLPPNVGPDMLEE